MAVRLAFAAAAAVVVSALAVRHGAAGARRHHPRRRWAEAEAAEERGEEVHVGEAPRLVDGEVEIAVEEQRPGGAGAAVHWTGLDAAGGLGLSALPASLDRAWACMREREEANTRGGVLVGEACMRGFLACRRRL